MIFARRNWRSAVAEGAHFPAGEPGRELAPQDGLDHGELIERRNQVLQPVPLPGRL